MRDRTVVRIVPLHPECSICELNHRRVHPAPFLDESHSAPVRSTISTHLERNVFPRGFARWVGEEEWQANPQLLGCVAPEYHRALDDWVW